MTSVNPRIHLLWLPMLLASARAQSPDRAPVPVVLRAELDDGTPMPAVPIVRRERDARLRVDPRDGWLRHVDPKLVDAAATVVGRTDPDGKLAVLVPDGTPASAGIAAGAPFRTVSLAKNGDLWVLRVVRLEQFVVKAIDADGKPLVAFPLALQRDGHDESLAVTDASGVATFGVDPATSARLVVVPVDWTGPTDWFPTVAKQLPDKQLQFVVPPFGRVRVRALVNGVPTPVAIESAALDDTGRASWSPDPAGVHEHRGVEFGPVAVGQEVRGSVRFASGRATFAAPAVSRHGEIVVVDIDADPPRPHFAFLVVAPGIEKQRPGGNRTVGIRVAAAIHTDAGEFRTNVGMDDDGLALVTFDRDVMLGRRLLRVDVDVEEHVIAVTPDGHRETRRAWSGTRTIDRELENVAIHLGTVEVTSHAGLLRGRVIDEHGAPVKGAKIEVSDAARAGAALAQWTDEDGRFELLGPLLRDESGAPVRLVASASLGQGADAMRTGLSAPMAAGGDVTFVLQPAAPRGFLELTLRDPRALPAAALQFAFAERHGRVRELGYDRVTWSGERNQICRLGPLPVGRGALRILLRPGVLLRTVEDLDITTDVCRDPRLADVDLSDVATCCRMRVVDEAGVPIAGARIEYRGASRTWSAGPSDGGGMLDVLKGPPQSLRIVVSAPGKQPLEVADVIDGADIRLREMPALCITVKGLPPDVPRDGLLVILRSVVRENLADMPRLPLGAGDIAAGPLPPPGRYHVRLCKQVDIGAGTGWTMLGQRSEDALITLDAQTLELPVDDATLQRLRELTKK